MGQVPYGIVGSGRMATHFAHYLKLCDVPFAQWDRHDPRPMSDVLGSCETICLLIRDDAIEPFARDHASFFCGRKLAHFSGALVTDAASGLHPLMTFGRKLYPRATYERVPFVTELGRAGLRELFPMLANPTFAIPSSKRPLYHALCMLGGNLSQVLAGKLVTELERSLGIPGEMALPFLLQSMENFADDPHAALTGPLARKDIGTLRMDIGALRQAGDPYADVLETVAAMHVPKEELRS